MTHSNFNPLLIHALTLRPLEDIPVSPSLTDLPSELARLVAANLDEVPRVFPKNNMFFVCKSCKRRARYDMGHTSINMDKYMKGENKNIENYAQHTGYFRCKQCNSAGNWIVIQNYKIFIASQMLQVSLQQQENPLLSFGKNQLFDGSEHRFASDAEEHLLHKIIQMPEDAFLWNKLGNLYYKSSRADLAVAAFEHSLTLDPLQTESYYSLSMILANIAPEFAVQNSYKMLATAHLYDKIPAPELRKLIAATFNYLMHINLSAGTEIQLLPGEEVYEELAIKFPTPTKEQPSVFTGDVELDNIESFYPLVEVFLGERKNEFKKTRRK